MIAKDINYLYKAATAEIYDTLLPIMKKVVSAGKAGRAEFAAEYGELAIDILQGPFWDSIERDSDNLLCGHCGMTSDEVQGRETVVSIYDQN